MAIFKIFCLPPNKAPTAGYFSDSQLGCQEVHPIKCEVTHEINGIYEVAMEVACDDAQKWRSLYNGVYLMVHVPNAWNYDWFEIYKTVTHAGTREIYAVHVHNQTRNIIVNKGQFKTGSSVESALKIILADTWFTGTSELTLKKPVSADMVTGLECITALVEASGGELETYRNVINIVSKLGADGGYKIEYGKNLISIGDTQDNTERVNKCYPVIDNQCKDENEVKRTLTMNEVRTLGGIALDKDYIALEDIYWEYSKVLKCDGIALNFDDPSSNSADGSMLSAANCLVEMTKQASAYIDAQYAKTRSVAVDYVGLEQTIEFPTYQTMGSTLQLGETAEIIYSSIWVDVKMRVCKYVYDALIERHTSVEFGTPTNRWYRDVVADNKRTQVQIGKTQSIRYVTTLPTTWEPNTLYAKYE